MSVLIDYIGSFLMSGVLFFIVLTLNENVRTTTIARNLDLISQEAASNSLQILEDDLYKLGYRASGNPLVKADSLAIIFKADLNDDGLPDSVQYSVGDTLQLKRTTNPKDRPLYRQVNKGLKNNVVSGIVQFKISYLDSAGGSIPYNLLLQQSYRSMVRTIGLNYRVEPSDPITSTETPVFVRKIIRPKNINGW